MCGLLRLELNCTTQHCCTSFLVSKLREKPDLMPCVRRPESRCSPTCPTALVRLHTITLTHLSSVFSTAALWLPHFSQAPTWGSPVVASTSSHNRRYTVRIVDVVLPGSAGSEYRSRLLDVLLTQSCSERGLCDQLSHTFPSLQYAFHETFCLPIYPSGVRSAPFSP